MSCISVYELKKDYGRVKALDGISFDVEYNHIFGFLGPNGAGKTTTIKILTTLIQPTSGKVTILGHDLIKGASQIRENIGVVQQKPSLESHLTVERSLDLYGLLWNVKNNVRKERIEHLLEIFGLAEVRNVRVDELSIGQKRRLQVAREFIHDMKLLFLDEPTVGLDPAARRMLLDYIKARVREGLTVFFTTHIMEEAEYLCDEVAIINNGTLVTLDTPNGLKQKYGGVKKVEIKLEPVNDLARILERVAFDEVDINGRSIKIRSKNAEGILADIIAILGRNNIHIESISINPPTLEETFLSIIKSDGNASDSQVNN